MPDNHPNSKVYELTPERRYQILARLASNYLEASERYMAGQRLGRMREAHIDNLRHAREQLQLELDEARLAMLRDANAR